MRLFRLYKTNFVNTDLSKKSTYGENTAGQSNAGKWADAWSWFREIPLPASPWIIKIVQPTTQIAVNTIIILFQFPVLYRNNTLFCSHRHPQLGALHWGIGCGWVSLENIAFPGRMPHVGHKMIRPFLWDSHPESFLCRIGFLAGWSESPYRYQYPATKPRRQERVCCSSRQAPSCDRIPAPQGIGAASNPRQSLSRVLSHQ